MWSSLIRALMVGSYSETRSDKDKRVVYFEYYYILYGGAVGYFELLHNHPISLSNRSSGHKSFFTRASAGKVIYR